MFVLGHAGLTLGAALAIDYAAKGRKNHASAYMQMAAAFPMVARHVDTRLLLVGSLLPDMVDKPLGLFIMADSLSNGHVFAHTLLFVLALAATGWWMWRKRRKPWLLVLAFGSLMHLLLDSMWLEPDTLWWPALGLSFGVPDEAAGWLGRVIDNLFRDPAVFIPEVLGLTVLLVFAIQVFRERSFGRVVRTGRLLPIEVPGPGRG